MRKSKELAILSAVVALGTMSVTASAASAATPGGDSYSTTLPTYTVTATRLLENVNRVPSETTVITSKTLAAQNLQTIQQALQQVPGLTIGRQADGGISLRGFDSKDILVMVDGMPMNNPYDGLVKFNSIPVDNVRRIEVTQGAGSSLYGGHAVAGVINILTKDLAKKGVEGTANFTYGTHNTTKASVGVNGKINDKWSAGLFVSRKSTDGYVGFLKSVSPLSGSRLTKEQTVVQAKPGTLVDGSKLGLEKDADGKYIIGGRGARRSKDITVNTYVKYHINPASWVRYMYNYTDSTYSYTDPFSYLVADGKPTFSGVFSMAGSTTEKPIWIKVSPYDYLGHYGEMAQNSHSLQYRNDATNFTAALSYVGTTIDGYTSASYMAKDTNWTGAGDFVNHPASSLTYTMDKTWSNLGPNKAHTIVAGMQWQRATMTQTKYDLSNWTDNSSRTGISNESKGTVHSSALYVQDKWYLSNPVALYLGLRLDHFDQGKGTSWEKSRTGTVTTRETGSETYNYLSPKISLAYTANDKLSYFASLGKSFNPPSLFSLYRDSNTPFGYYIHANANLKPEKSTSFEVGAKWHPSAKTRLNLTYFHIDTKDKIVLSDKMKEAETGVEYKKYINLDNDTRDGVELSLNHTFSKELSGYLNYTFQKGTEGKAVSEIKANKTATGVYIPRNILQVGLTYDKGRTETVLTGNFVSRRQADNYPTGRYGSRDPYFLLNLSEKYKINKDASVLFGIDNLLNREYYSVDLADGRTYRLGLEYHF